MLICYNTIYLDLVFEEIQGVIYWIYPYLDVKSD